MIDGSHNHWVNTTILSSTNETYGESGITLSSIKTFIGHSQFQLLSKSSWKERKEEERERQEERERERQREKETEEEKKEKQNKQYQQLSVERIGSYMYSRCIEILYKIQSCGH